MMGNIFTQVPGNVVKELKMHNFVLFKDLDFKRFTDKIVAKLNELLGYKTEGDYAEIAKKSAETSDYDDPKLKKLFSELVKDKLQMFDHEFEEYVGSLPRRLPEELKKDKEVMSKFDDIRVPDRDGLLEERYIRYVLGLLATSLVIAALKMTESGRKLIKKEQEADCYPGKAFYAGSDMLSMHYLGEKTIDDCPSITKDDVRRLGKELSVFSPHKMGWLPQSF